MIVFLDVNDEVTEDTKILVKETVTDDPQPADTVDDNKDDQNTDQQEAQDGTHSVHSLLINLVKLHIHIYMYLEFSYVLEICAKLVLFICTCI